MKKIIIVLITVALTGAVAGQESAHYHANESSGSTAFDFSGSDNDGTYQGDLPNSTTGINQGTGEWDTGTGQDFDGGGDYVSLPSGLANASEDFAVSFWIRRDGNSQEQRFLSLGGDIQFTLLINENSCNLDQLSVYDGSISCYNQDINAGNLYHIVLTYADSTGESYLFINGTSSDTMVIQPGNNNESSNWGTDRAGTASKATDAMMDELHVFNKNLTGAEINSLYNSNNIQVNSAPSIDAFTISPDPLELNEPIDFSYDISDSDGNIVNVTLEAFLNGQNQKTEFFSHNSSTINETQTNWYEPAQDGNYTFYLTAEDNQGATSTASIERELDTISGFVTTLDVPTVNHDRLEVQVNDLQGELRNIRVEDSSNNVLASINNNTYSGENVTLTVQPYNKAEYHLFIRANRDENGSAETLSADSYTVNGVDVSETGQEVPSVGLVLFLVLFGFYISIAFAVVQVSRQWAT